jgi:secreted trypsin-like serine protease
VHPDYIHETYTNDICIVVLSSPVTEVTPVALNTDRSTPSDGADVQVIGMGFTKEVGPDDDSKPFPDFLLMTELQIVPTDTCSNEYTNAGEQAINGELDICAYATGKDSCQGDSGGPLLQTIDDSFVQVGIVSYGKGCAKEVSCRYSKICGPCQNSLMQYPNAIFR